jgi:hypothetical protein
MWDTTRCHWASSSARYKGSWFVCGLGLLDPKYGEWATLRIVGGLLVSQLPPAHPLSEPQMSQIKNSLKNLLEV